MPKLIYLYTTGGAPRLPMSDTPPLPDLSLRTHNRYAVNAQSDGMVNMLVRFAKYNPNYDELLIFIDSTVQTGHINISPCASLYVIPSINQIAEYIDPGDVLIVRGGFKSWIPLLAHVQDLRQNWMLFYRANTSHGSWPFWDVVLNDLIDTPRVIGKRLHYHFVKPVNEDIFGLIDAPGLMQRHYDFMIGASHIHRKKGQYQAVQALQKYYQIYGKKPKCVLPGGFVRCMTNDVIRGIMAVGDVDITMPGGMDRRRLALLMNQCKIFVHAGVGGQNDRSILEAIACGMFPIIANQERTAPFVSSIGRVWSFKERNYIDLMEIMHSVLESNLWEYPVQMSQMYNNINGLSQVAMPRLEDLLNFTKENPSPDRKEIIRRFIDNG